MSESADGASAEARWLRAHWDEATLGGFAREWIAVCGREVVDHDPRIGALIERTRGLRPLYAFVVLGPVQ